MSNKPTQESFLKDISNHDLEILLDNGVYRHLRFKKKDSNIMWFDLTTWPGFLCFSGDMGCFVFQRLTDMFEFFRTDRKINPSYWSEKVQAVYHSGYSNDYKHFSAKKFAEKVNEYVNDYIKDNYISEIESIKLKENINNYVLYDLENDNEYDLRRNLSNFSTKVFDIDGVPLIFEFQDSWEWNFYEYTYHFLWCCYALIWGIKKYDERKGKV